MDEQERERKHKQSMRKYIKSDKGKAALKKAAVIYRAKLALKKEGIDPEKFMKTVRSEIKERKNLWLYSSDDDTEFIIF
jgi:hypothetical protein